MAITALRLTVWRPLNLERRIARSGSTRGEWPISRGDDLYVEAFRWHLADLPWASIDSDDTTILRKTLVERFSPFEPVAARGFDQVAIALDDFKTVIDAGRSSWRVSSQEIPAATEDDEDQAYQVDSILAFYLQLKWIYRVFHAVPAANVTVR